MKLESYLTFSSLIKCISLFTARSELTMLVTLSLNAFTNLRVQHNLQMLVITSLTHNTIKNYQVLRTSDTMNRLENIMQV